MNVKNCQAVCDVEREMGGRKKEDMKKAIDKK